MAAREEQGAVEAGARAAQEDQRVVAREDQGVEEVALVPQPRAASRVGWE